MMAECCFECEDKGWTEMVSINTSMYPNVDGSIIATKTRKVPCPYCKSTDFEAWLKENPLEFV